MALANDHSPFPPANFYDQPVGKPPKARRNRRDTAAIALVMFGKKLARRFVESCPTGKVTAQSARIVGAPGHQASEQPLLFTGPQWGLPAFGEPDMIGMVMRRDDPCDR